MTVGFGFHEREELKIQPQINMMEGVEPMKRYKSNENTRRWCTLVINIYSRRTGPIGTIGHSSGTHLAAPSLPGKESGCRGRTRPP